MTLQVFNATIRPMTMMVVDDDEMPILPDGFPARGRRAGGPIDIRVELRDAPYPIWRHFTITQYGTLTDLHYTIQSAMGWLDYHMHEFTVAGATFAPSTVETVHVQRPKRVLRTERLEYDEDLVELSRHLTRGQQFVYEYDFGDRWVHDCTVTRVHSGGMLLGGPVLIDGAGDCPVEDSGGVAGYAAKLMQLQELTARQKATGRPWRDVAIPGHDDELVRWWYSWGEPTPFTIAGQQEAMYRQWSGSDAEEDDDAEENYLYVEEGEGGLPTDLTTLNVPAVSDEYLDRV